MLKASLRYALVGLVLVASSSGQDAKADASRAPSEQGPGGRASGVRGIVADWARVPIHNAYILVHRDESDDVHSRTDADGKYAVPLKLGIYDVFISAKGFSPTSRKIEVTPDGMMVYDAVLQVNPLGMNVD